LLAAVAEPGSNRETVISSMSAFFVELALADLIRRTIPGTASFVSLRRRSGCECPLADGQVFWIDSDYLITVDNSRRILSASQVIPFLARNCTIRGCGSVYLIEEPSV